MKTEDLYKEDHGGHVYKQLSLVQHVIQQCNKTSSIYESILIIYDIKH